MNGNTKFLPNLNEERQDQELSQLVSIETCGIHTVHNAFKNGENASGWKLKTLLSSMFKILQESPSRWADYELLTEALESYYPLKFCSHRWVENEDVAKRAKAVWHKIVTITEFWVGLPKSKQPGLGQRGKNSSYDHLRNCYKDSLVPVKLQFFEEIAKSLNKFSFFKQMNIWRHSWLKPLNSYYVTFAPSFSKRMSCRKHQQPQN